MPRRLTEKVLEALHAALRATPNPVGREIAKQLRAQGLRVSESTISKHAAILGIPLQNAGRPPGIVEKGPRPQKPSDNRERVLKLHAKGLGVREIARRMTAAGQRISPAAVSKLIQRAATTEEKK